MEGRDILVAEDEDATRYLCETLLRKEGHRVTLASNAAAVRRAIEHGHIDLVLLDLCLPDADGYDLAPQLHRRGIPFLIMTARGAPHERVVGFESGAVDYLVKPFHPGELIQRVRMALGRSANAGGEDARAPDVLGHWQLDSDQYALISQEANVRIDMTQGEFALMKALVTARERVVSREALMDIVSRDGGGGNGNLRSVDVLVSRLRRKFEAGSHQHSRILTVPGIGYRLERRQKKRE